VDLEGFEYFSEYEEMFDWEWDINPDVMDIEEVIGVMTAFAIGANLIGAMRGVKDGHVW